MIQITSLQQHMSRPLGLQSVAKIASGSVEIVLTRGEARQVIAGLNKAIDDSFMQGDQYGRNNGQI